METLYVWLKYIGKLNWKRVAPNDKMILQKYWILISTTLKIWEGLKNGVIWYNFFQSFEKV